MYVCVAIIIYDKYIFHTRKLTYLSVSEHRLCELRHIYTRHGSTLVTGELHGCCVINIYLNRLK